MSIKSVAFSVIAALAAIPFWFFFYDAIRFGAGNALASTYAILFLTVHLVASNILLLFAERSRLLILAYMLGMAPLFYFFGNPLAIIAVWALLCAGAVISYSRVRLELKSRITFHIPILLRQGLPTLLTALSLACAVGYYVETARAPERLTIQDIFPRSVFTGIFQNTVPLLSDKFFPGFEPDDTIDSYIEKQFRTSGVDLQRVSQEERLRVLKEARTQLFSKAAGNITFPELTGQERLVDVFYDIGMARSEQFFDSNKRFAPLTLAIGFFLFLRTVALPYGWVLIFLTAGIVAGMKKGGMVVHGEEHAVKERLDWA